jgi:hypothetical protein
MKAKPENDKALVQMPKVQQDRIKAPAVKRAARADGPPMKLVMKEGTSQITFNHADHDLAHMLLMADLGTCDLHFLAGMQCQTASIGAPGRKIDEGASNFPLSVV